MPCTGCGGPCPNEPEQGAAMIGALASILGVSQDREGIMDAEKLIDQIKDPVGTFYRYSIPHSILRRKVIKE
jgi:F420-non-reducing hydrogenase small subunit